MNKRKTENHPVASQRIHDIGGADGTFCQRICISPENPLSILDKLLTLQGQRAHNATHTYNLKR